MLQSGKSVGIEREEWDWFSIDLIVTKIMARRLGQHFLINKIKQKKIIDALDLKSNDVVIEIGPGHGELTQELRIKNTELKIIAIEKDKKLFEYLKKKFAFDKNTEIIQGDALKIFPKLCLMFHTLSFKIVGNIPYYITGRLLRIISELRKKPSLIVLTVQKEVAERITAKPPKMNLLAASVQFWAEPEIIGYISKRDFKPMPKVDSAIIRLATRVQPLTTRGQVEKYYNFIKILFKQPRKTIFNNLSSSQDDSFGFRQPNIGTSDVSNIRTSDVRELIIEKLKKIGINPNDRPQNLSVKQILKLLTLL